MYHLYRHFRVDARLDADSIKQIISTSNNFPAPGSSLGATAHLYLTKQTSRRRALDAAAWEAAHSPHANMHLRKLSHSIIAALTGRAPVRDELIAARDITRRARDGEAAR